MVFDTVMMSPRDEAPDAPRSDRMLPNDSVLGMSTVSSRNDFLSVATLSEPEEVTAVMYRMSAGKQASREKAQQVRRAHQRK